MQVKITDIKRNENKLYCDDCNIPYYMIINYEVNFRVKIGDETLEGSMFKEEIENITIKQLEEEITEYIKNHCTEEVEGCK